MLSAFRLTKTKYVKTAFDGKGAAMVGGRWNSQGTRMVYTSSTLSLATMEVMVNLDDYEVLCGLYSYISIHIPERIVEVIDPSRLPKEWDSLAPGATSQVVGDTWVSDARSAVLAVPSVVTPGELNYLLNPSHADFGLITIDKPKPFVLDERLMD